MDRVTLVAHKPMHHSRPNLRLCHLLPNLGIEISAWKESKRLRLEPRHLTRLKTRLAYNSVSFVTKATLGGNLVLKAFRQRLYLCTHDDLYGHAIIEVCSASFAHASSITAVTAALGLFVTPSTPSLSSPSGSFPCQDLLVRFSLDCMLTLYEG